MKSYVFTEMELKQRIDKLQGTYHNTMDLVEAGKLVDEMVVGKTPVEEVASGEYSFKGGIRFVERSVNNESLSRIFDKYDGKNIKIYVEEL